MIFSTVGGARAPSSLVSETAGNPSLGKEEFLQLLVAQLRNQDPLNPTNPEQMAAQLAQFSSLEQLINVNEALAAQADEAAALAGAMNSSTALGVIGKDVLAVGDAVTLSGNGGESVTVGVDGGGGAGTLNIYDANGTLVGTSQLGVLPPGRQEIPLGTAANGLPAGQYRYELQVTDPAGNPVSVQTFTLASIDGVRYGPQGPVLTSGGAEFPLADIVEVIARQG